MAVRKSLHLELSQLYEQQPTHVRVINEGERTVHIKIRKVNVINVKKQYLFSLFDHISFKKLEIPANAEIMYKFKNMTIDQALDYFLEDATKKNPEQLFLQF